MHQQKNAPFLVAILWVVQHEGKRVVMTVRSQAVLRIERRASASLGLFTTSDAEHAGVSNQLVSYHSRPGGRWQRVLPKVYELRGLAPNTARPLLAAQLWAGPEAALSHRAAAWIFGLDGIHHPRPELWSTKMRTPKGVTVHRGTVPSDQVATTRGLRHTTLLRTVLDVARVVDDDCLELVVESALRRDRSIEGELRGSVRLDRVMKRRRPGEPPTESELETRYLQVIRGADIPPPIRQYEVIEDGHCLARLDLCWPEAGLWVELDGRAWHDRPRALLTDRHRQNELVTRLQWQPLRFTWDDVVDRPQRTARATERALTQRSEEVRRFG